MSDQKPICDNQEDAPAAAEEEEMVDPHEKLRESCRAKPVCAVLFEKLTTCNNRVHSRSKTAETCVEELIDFVECVDKCAAKNLFKYLK